MKRSGTSAALRRAQDIVRTRSEGYCEARTDVCVIYAAQVHHCLRGNPRVHDPEAMLDVCVPCHDRIHAHPAEAYAAGWLRHRSAS